MADNYQYNETTGKIVADTSAIKAEVEQEYKDALGQDLDVSESTPQGRLIEAETVARKRVVENMALLANTFNPQQSFGIFLDALAYLFGIDRVGATSTRVIATCSGTANTVIPAGSQAKDSNGNLYYSESTLTIGASGTVQGYFAAYVKGAIECPAASLTTIVTAVTGWSSITNVAAGETGLEGESDISLRQNLPIKQYQGASLLDAIKSKVLAVENVVSCEVADNPTGNSDTSRVPGKTLPPHSLWVCVDGGTDSAVALAINNGKEPGCNYAGSDVTESVVNAGQTYTVKFDRVVAVPVYIDVTVNVSNVSGSTTINEEAIKNAILAYAAGEVEGVDGLKLGIDVNAFEIASAITIQIPELFIEEVKVSSDNSNWATSVSIAKYQKGTISAANITVHQN